MINILLVGAGGNMGRCVLESQKHFDNLHIVAGIDKENCTLIPTYSSFDNVTEKIDVVLDFSSHYLTPDVLRFCENSNLPLVLCTTGHTEEEIKKINKTGKKIPLLYSSNMSYGVFVLHKMAALGAKFLNGYDVHILESHHKNKKDAPSGTAVKLKDTILKVRPTLKDKITFSSIRGGSVIGEHSVFFFGDSERLILSHIAENRFVFAIGALKACIKILNKKPKLYTYASLFGSR